MLLQQHFLTCARGQAIHTSLVTHSDIQTAQQTTLIQKHFLTRVAGKVIHISLVTCAGETQECPLIQKQFRTCARGKSIHASLVTREHAHRTSYKPGNTFCLGLGGTVRDKKIAGFVHAHKSCWDARVGV
jgi:hypothetical protein